MNKKIFLAGLLLSISLSVAASEDKRSREGGEDQYSQGNFAHARYLKPKTVLDPLKEYLATREAPVLDSVTERIAAMSAARSAKPVKAAEDK